MVRSSELRKLTSALLPLQQKFDFLLPTVWPSPNFSEVLLQKRCFFVKVEVKVTHKLKQQQQQQELQNHQQSLLTAKFFLSSPKSTLEIQRENSSNWKVQQLQQQKKMEINLSPRTSSASTGRQLSATAAAGNSLHKKNLRSWLRIQHLQTNHSYIPTYIHT